MYFLGVGGTPPRCVRDKVGGKPFGVFRPKTRFERFRARGSLERGGRVHGSGRGSKGVVSV